MATVKVFADVMMVTGIVFWLMVITEFIVEFVIPAVVTLIKKFINVIYRMVTEIWDDIRGYREYKRLRNYYYDFDEALAEEANKRK